MLAKDLQSPNAQPPMALTELGIVMFVKDSQLKKANCPMAVTELRDGDALQGPAIAKGKVRNGRH